MRILLTHHLPDDVQPSGPRTSELVRGLRHAGHQVRVLAVDTAPNGTDSAATRRIVCSIDDPSADLPFDLPAFQPRAGAPSTFTSLTDAALAQYRDVLRRALDEEVDRFNPHLIHCQHLWLFGHLALESGAPYLVEAYGPELEAAAADSRFAPYVEQTAENAGRILVHHFDLQPMLLKSFDLSRERCAEVPRSISVLLELYEHVLAERFGH